MIYIYLIKSKLNNKCYVGQTIDYQKRMKEHIYGRNDNRNSIIDRALKKYGIENFEFNIIDISYDQETADDLERKYIKDYKCLRPSGYNILKGGRNQHGSWNERKVFMYDLYGNYICEFENSSYAERKTNHKYLRKGINSCCLGKAKKYKDKIFSYEKHDKINPYVKPKSSRNKKVYQFDLTCNLIGSYDSITIASKLTGTSRTSIIGCLKGNYKKANNFLWSYTKKCPNITITIERTHIIQCDDKGNKINEFPSCKEAERKLNLKSGSYKNIYNRLDKNKKAYGYYWKRVF